jgi:hypothetical protein
MSVGHVPGGNCWSSCVCVPDVGVGARWVFGSHRHCQTVMEHAGCWGGHEVGRGLLGVGPSWRKWLGGTCAGLSQAEGKDCLRPDTFPAQLTYCVMEKQGVCVSGGSHQGCASLFSPSSCWW